MAEHTSTSDYSDPSSAANSPKIPHATQQSDVIGKQHISQLEDYEQTGDERLPFILSLAELKLLGIAGVSNKILTQSSRWSRDYLMAFFSSYD